MRRRLLVLTAVLFLITGAAYLYVASGRLHQRVRLALEAAAGRQFHRQVRIAVLRGDPLQGLVLEGVALARGDRLAEGTIVTADQIAVRFRPVALLGDLLRRRGALRSIAEITLVRPEINLEISSAGLPRCGWRSTWSACTATGAHRSPSRGSTSWTGRRSTSTWPRWARRCSSGGRIWCARRGWSSKMEPRTRTCTC